MSELTGPEERKWKAYASEQIDHKRENSTMVDIQEVFEYIDGDMYFSGVMEKAFKRGDKKEFSDVFWAAYSNYMYQIIEDKQLSEWVEEERQRRITP